MTHHMAIKKRGSTQVSAFVTLFLRVNDSKKLLRTGWVREGIEKPESVAEHLFSLSFLTMQLSPILAERLGHTLNTHKLLKMAMLHDLAEIEVGDIVTSRGSVTNSKKQAQKRTLEKKGIKKLFSAVDPSNLTSELFSEYIEHETVEAKLLGQLDKLDMALQALSFELDQKKNLSEFFEHAKANITDEFLLEVLQEIVDRRR